MSTSTRLTISGSPGLDASSRSASAPSSATSATSLPSCLLSREPSERTAPSKARVTFSIAATDAARAAADGALTSAFIASRTLRRRPRTNRPTRDGTRSPSCDAERKASSASEVSSNDFDSASALVSGFSASARRSTSASRVLTAASYRLASEAPITGGIRVSSALRPHFGPVIGSLSRASMRTRIGVRAFCRSGSVVRRT